MNAATTYQTSSGTAHSNPIVLDSAGRISGSQELYLQPGQIYKFIMHTSADVLLWTQDGIGATPISAANQDIEALAGENIAAEASAYISDGSGGKNAGQIYNTDADLTYSSTEAVTVGMVPLAIAIGENGTLRTGGQITVTGPLTPGARYYVSATAGGITSTAPTFARFMGQAQSATVLALTPNPASPGIDLFYIDMML